MAKHSDCTYLSISNSNIEDMVILNIPWFLW